MQVNETENIINQERSSIQAIEERIARRREDGRDTSQLQQEQEAAEDRAKNAELELLEARLAFCESDTDCKNCVRTRTRLGYAVGHINQCYSCDVDCRECVEYRTERQYHPSSVAACHGGYLSHSVISNTSSVSQRIKTTE